jgi:preprotein translocase subunit SecB
MSKTTITPNTGNDPKLHPIQLVNLGVRELYIHSNRPPDVNIGAEPGECSMKISTTPYNSKDKRIAVVLTLESGIGADQSKAPYAMRIELVGIFEVDEAEFPIKHTSHWAKNNAPLVLYPYLREHAFGLSLRCGFKPLLLPLLEVPTFKIDKTPRIKKKP